MHPLSCATCALHLHLCPPDHLHATCTCTCTHCCVHLHTLYVCTMCAPAPAPAHTVCALCVHLHLYLHRHRHLHLHLPIHLDLHTYCTPAVAHARGRRLWQVSAAGHVSRRHGRWCTHGRRRGCGMRSRRGAWRPRRFCVILIVLHGMTCAWRALRSSPLGRTSDALIIYTSVTIKSYISAVPHSHTHRHPHAQHMHNKSH